MSLITQIDGVPLYTTSAEAVLWARQYGLIGYHTHVVLGQVGYMGGTSHSLIVSAMQQGVQNIPTTQQVRSTSMSSNLSSGSSGY